MEKKRQEKGEEEEEKSSRRHQKSYFDVLGLCCSSEVPLIEKILNSLEGVEEVSVIVTSKTVIVVHDSLLISPSQIAKALNQARLEASVRVNGETTYPMKWPSLYVMVCGVLLGMSFLKYVYPLFRWLAVAAVIVGIGPIIVRAFAAVKNLTLDVNILIIITVMGTVGMQDYLEAGTIVFLFAIAEWLQSRASHEANAVMSSLMSIAPQTATLAETGELVNVEQVNPGTILAVKTGQVIPIDGVVVEGSCEVDEKTLTGEAFPVSKLKDSPVWAGTINLNGYISVKTSALSEDCVVAKMAKLVEEAQNKKPRFQRLIDECAKYYTPAVVLVSFAIAIIPAAMRLHNINHWLHLALVVLVSACPCGLILSTPVATFCALSKAASNGLLIKGGDHIETLAKVKTVAFDKTGTITTGEFIVSSFQCLSIDITPDTLLYWVSSIESKSSHPVADALVCYSKSRSVEPKPENVQGFQNFPGEGVSGKIDDKELYVGNRRLGERAGGSQTECSSEEGRTIGYVYSSGAIIGTFGLVDSCRSGSAEAIKDLKSMGLKTAMLTGDNHAAATHAQGQLSNVMDHFHAELLPEDKARIINEYKKCGAVAMVGDGVNDAPALATADIGISMAVSGSALATETGHVILMSNDLRRIPKAIRLARRTRVKVIQNIVFSFITKAAVLGVAFAGHPMIWLAVLVDVFTCLLVILNSMFLLRGSYATNKQNSSSCKNNKCNGGTLVHQHHHKQCCSKKDVDQNSSISRGYGTDKCRDLEGQVEHCLKDECHNECGKMVNHTDECQNGDSNDDDHHGIHVHEHTSRGNFESLRRECCRGHHHHGGRLAEIMTV